MRIWADVYNNTNVKIGSAVELSGASVTKALDGAGSFTLTFPAASEAMFDLLQLERKVRLYVEQDEQPRLLGSGVIRDLTVDESSSNARVTINGPDALDALTRRSVLLGRSYTSTLIASVAANLVGLVPGWSINVSDTRLVTARFDGTSVLKALIRLAEENGLHVREGSDLNTLELGAFGTNNGIVALKPDSVSLELDNRDDIVLIDQLTRKSNSREVVNWIIPLGAGDGAAALTLADRSHTVPSITGPDGATLTYLSDTDSVDAYRKKKKIVAFKEIVPIATSLTARQLAADALYVAASEWLTRNSQPLVTYTLSARKCKTLVCPGDKIRVHYKGLVETESGGFTYLDINDLFWVMKVTEAVNEGGVSTQLELSTIDRMETDGVSMVVNAIEQISVQNLNVKPSFNRSNMGPYKRELDSTHSISIPLKITDATIALARCLLTVKSRPFRATAKAAAAGGDHYHMMTGIPGGATAGTLQTYPVADNNGGIVQIEIETLNPGIALRTFGASGNHTHPMNYGIYDDTVYPNAVTIQVDGTTVASNLGAGGVGFSTVIDITQALINAGGGLQQEHTILITCTGGQGEIEAQIELYDLIIPFKIGTGVS